MGSREDWLSRDPYSNYLVFGYIGEVDLAMEELERAVRERTPSLIYLQARAPEAVRNDPRYLAIVEKMAFPRN